MRFATRKKISVTIPAYNEEDTLEEVVTNALDALDSISPKYEILLVDDGSTDTTRKIIKSLLAKYPKKLRSIRHRYNKGFSAAMNTCYQNAKGDYIFLGPADGQFDYFEIAGFIEKGRDYDVVVGYRVYNEETWQRKCNSFIFHTLARFLFDIRLREFSSCILYKQHVRNAITVKADSYACLFLPEFIYRALAAGYRIGEVPIHFYSRKGGKQKGTNFRMIVKTFIEMLIFKYQILTNRV